MFDHLKLDARLLLLLSLFKMVRWFSFTNAQSASLRNLVAAANAANVQYAGQQRVIIIITR